MTASVLTLLSWWKLHHIEGYCDPYLHDKWGQRSEGCSFEMRLTLSTFDYKRVSISPSSLLCGPSSPTVLALTLVKHLVALTQRANLEESSSASWLSWIVSTEKQWVRGAERLCHSKGLYQLSPSHLSCLSGPYQKACSRAQPELILFCFCLCSPVFLFSCKKVHVVAYT